MLECNESDAFRFAFSWLKAENCPTNKTLLPLLLQLFLVRSVFLLIPIPPQNKSPGPERGISIISHAHEQQEHSWLPPSKASRGHVCAVCSWWEFERHVVQLQRRPTLPEPEPEPAGVRSHVMSGLQLLGFFFSTSELNTRTPELLSSSSSCVCTAKQQT